MTISDQQAAAVFAGEPGSGWRRIVPNYVPVPDVIRGFSVDRMERYSNPWEYTIELDAFPDFTNIPYHYAERRYTAIDPATGLLFIYHHGPLSQLEDGTWATEQSDGFGGRRVHILMQDGRRAILRGPWHGGAPAGAVEVYCRVNGRSCFGYFLHADLFFSIAKKFAPKLQPVMASNPWGERYDLGDPVPKNFTAEQERI